MPPQPGLLARALRALAAHPEKAQALGLAAREHVAQHHTPGGTAAQVAQLLRDVAGR